MTRTVSTLLAACLAGASIGAAADGPHHGHHHFPQDVDAFHTVLAPVWHAAPGASRLQSACAKAGEMETLVQGIRSGNATLLLGKVLALQASCRGGAGVEGALGAVHDAFHRLIDHSPAHR